MLLLLAACSVARHGASGFGLLGGPSQGCSAGFKHVAPQAPWRHVGIVELPSAWRVCKLGS